MADRTVFVVLSIDVEPDLPPEYLKQVEFYKSKIPNFTYEHFKTVAKMLSLHYMGAKWNWMIRTDNLIEIVHGNSDYMFNAFKEDFARILASGDDIGFHPHPYRYEYGLWRMERDETEQIRVIEKSYDAVASLGFKLKSVRTGWDTMSSSMMETLDNMGFVSELSAMPGMSKKDAIVGYSYDWAKTPTFPYHPSCADYQQIGDMRILEIPQTINRVKRITGNIFVSAFNPCGRNSLYKPCMIDALNQAVKQGSSFLVGFTHLEDFIYLRGRISKLLRINGFGNFRKNIQFLIERAAQQHVKVLFVTASEATKFPTAHST